MSARPSFALSALSVLLLTAGCITVPADSVGVSPVDSRGPGSSSAECRLSESDMAWVDRSIAAWRLTVAEILKMPDSIEPDVVVFDHACVLRGDGVIYGRERWRGTPHSGMVPLPNGDSMPVGVTSFAAPGGGETGVFFVMAAPSVWRSAGVDSRLGLEALMTAVWVHEMTHVFQFETYGRRIDALAAKWGFGDDLTDDVVQDRFESQTEFARAHASEVELLYRAAAARSDAEASRLAREALAAARSRQERWLADEDARYRELESVFLTLEGSGNWAAFSWLVAAEGGGIAHEAALAEFGRRGGRWTQDEGTAIFMVIDRLVDDWTSRVFGPDAPTAFELLEEATKAAAIPD